MRGTERGRRERERGWQGEEGSEGVRATERGGVERERKVVRA